MKNKTYEQGKEDGRREIINNIPLEKVTLKNGNDYQMGELLGYLRKTKEIKDWIKTVS